MTLAEYRKLTNIIKEYRVENKVKVFANAPFSKKIAVLRESMVYLHTAHSETFGISIVEAMAASCIPVVHNSGGAKDYVPKEWLYDNPESASQKVEEALTKWTPNVGDQMKKIAEQFNKSKFREDFSACFTKYLAQSDYRLVTFACRKEKSRIKTKFLNSN